MKHQDVRIGSLCTGYGGLDMAVKAVFGGELAWCADNDRHVSVILDVRYPGLSNLGDLTSIDWQQVNPVDLIAAGFPCQDISISGRGAGIEKGARSGIWKNIIGDICLLQPKIVVVENVAAIRRRGLDRVLGDLAEIGYDAVWTSVRAADVGAAHRRERVFILAHRPEAKQLLALAYARSQRRSVWSAARAAASPRSPGGSIRSCARAVPGVRSGHELASSGRAHAWGRYGEAVRRWERCTGRRAPRATEVGTRGQPRLSPAFTEWLMGLPLGFVTSLDLPYSAKQRALGNGVVPQQAIAALRQLVDIASHGTVESVYD